MNKLEYPRRNGAHKIRITSKSTLMFSVNNSKKYNWVAC